METTDDRIARALRALRHAKLLALAANQPHVVTNIFTAMFVLDQDAAYEPLLPYVLDRIERSNGTLEPATVVDWLRVTAGGVLTEDDVSRVVGIADGLVETRAIYRLPATNLADLVAVLDCLATALIGPAGSPARSTNRSIALVGDRIRAIHARAANEARSKVERDASPAAQNDAGWDFFNKDPR